MNRHSTRRGMTLLEIVIAVAIFTSAIAMAMGTLTATKQYQVYGQTQDAVSTDDADHIQSQISSDLSCSAWYFFSSEDANGNGALDAGEDVNLDGAIGTVDFANSANDRRMRYYPYVQANTAAGIGHAFPARIDPVGEPEYANFSPWTATRFPSWSSGSVASGATTVRTNALARGTIILDDLAREMVQPSNELIFLRVATGPWQADPREADHYTPDDMMFFPSYQKNAAGVTTAPPGARASDWRRADNYANLPTTVGWDTTGTHSHVVETVRRLTAWDDAGGTGVWVHRNSQVDPTWQEYGKPYGSPVWGAALNQGASGPRLRIQWETKAANRMYVDPTPGTDYQQPPSELREFIYAVVPSPSGFGRLVRAHSVDTSGTPVRGNEVGDWITDPTLPTGFQVDLVLSDDVVRATWTTRRHDSSLPVNVIRLRLVLARPTAGASTAGGQRQVVSRTIEMLFCMRTSNEYDDQKSAEDLIDVPVTATEPANIPFAY